MIDIRETLIRLNAEIASHQEQLVQQSKELTTKIEDFKAEKKRVVQSAIKSCGFTIGDIVLLSHHSWRIDELYFIGENRPDNKAYKFGVMAVLSGVWDSKHFSEDVSINDLIKI